MTARVAIAVVVVLLLHVGPLAAAAQPAPIQGTWSLEPAETSGKVNVEFRSSDRSGKDDVHSSFDVNAEALGILPAQLASPGNDVAFTWTHEAGSFACKGWLSSGKGGGTFLFTPSSEYLAKMRAAGYDTISSRDQVVAAMLDISTGYVGAIAAAGYAHLSFEKLIAFRALKIDDAYVRAMRAAFRSAGLSPDQVISLQALHVTPEYLAEMAAAGLAVDTAQDAVRLRALKIDAAYVKRVRAHGFANPTVDQLVRLKAMNVI